MEQQVLKRYNKSKYFEFGIEDIKEYRKLRTDLKLTFIITLCADFEGRAHLTKDVLASYLQTTRQTVSNYLREFVYHNLLKFKYSGDIFINPKVFYKGAPEDFEKVNNAYLLFKSDM